MKKIITLILSFLFASSIIFIASAENKLDCSEYSSKTLVGLADKMRCKKGLPAREKKTGLFDSINIFKKKEANQQEFDKPCNEYSTKTLVSLSKRMMCKKSKKNN